MSTSTTFTGPPQMNLHRSTTVSSSNNAFSMDLFKNLTEHNKTENVFYSPFSIFSALGMVQLGARGNTASQITEVLRLNKGEQPKPEEEECLQQQSQMQDPKVQRGERDAHADIKQLLSEINKTNAPYELSVANRLYGEQSFQFNEDYVRDTKKYYDAGLETMDFKNNSAGALVKINSWVEEKTHEKIKDLLADGMLNQMTKLVLVNAIYFKGNWNLQFDKRKTHDAQFKLSKNESKTVKMMRQKSKFPFADISEVKCKILEMPYETEDLSMLIFLPTDIEDDTTGLEKLEREMTYDRFVEWTSRVREVEVEVKLPQFKLEELYSLNEILIGLGMGDAFDSNKSDFSGMSLTKGLAVSNVVHKAFVEVNEEGTEAAAATGVTMVVTSFRPTETNTFFVDHPVLFFIRHNSTNTILFAGRLASPE